MYLGHFTNLVKSLRGWMCPPILKLRAFFENNGLFTLFDPLAPVDYVTTFFPFAAFFTYDSQMVRNEGLEGWVRSSWNTNEREEK